MLKNISWNIDSCGGG